MDDQEILPLVEETLDERNPRKWYSALMDYGAYLKKQDRKLNKKSKHYTRQAAFKGSDREIRGKIIKFLAEHGKLTASEITKREDMKSSRVKGQLERLVKEEMVRKERCLYVL